MWKCIQKSAGTIINISSANTVMPGFGIQMIKVNISVLGTQIGCHSKIKNTPKLYEIYQTEIDILCKSTNKNQDKQNQRHVKQYSVIQDLVEWCVMPIPMKVNRYYFNS